MWLKRIVVDDTGPTVTDTPGELATALLHDTPAYPSSRGQQRVAYSSVLEQWVFAPGLQCPLTPA
jgi:hypothetical protein